MSVFRLLLQNMTAKVKIKSKRKPPLSFFSSTSKPSPLLQVTNIFSVLNVRNSSNRSIFIESNDKKVLEILSEDMTVYPDFITEEEENSLLLEVEKSVKRLRYEYSHWDNAIHGYRETEKKNWNEKNAQILERVKQLVFPKSVCPLAYIHILDLAKEGYIKPHIDAVRFCGDTIAGLSLMSSCVMRLAREKETEIYGDVHLPQRSLYVMKNRARYELTHEVLKEEESFFLKNPITRERRISVICRNEPHQEDTL